MLEEMRKQSQRMAQLVEDLLTLSRTESQEHSEEETVAMQPMLATLRREAEAHSQGRHQISIDDLAGVDLQGSTKELHSAFSNLVTNAVRYTPAGGRIAVEFRREGDGAVLAVRDSGYGIPATHLPRLTERFYRVSSSRSREWRYRTGPVDRQAHPRPAPRTAGDRKRSRQGLGVLLPFRCRPRAPARVRP